MRRYSGSILAGLVVLAVLAGGAMEAMGQSAADFQRILKEKSPALVTIKFLLKVKSGTKESENQAEATGVMIDPKGLILCSNMQLGGVGAYYRSMGRDISTTPTELKVLIGEDAEGLDARVLTRDTELDLAWVQVKDPGGRTFAWIDLGDSAEGKIGEPILAVRRMSKVFDRVAMVSESRVACLVKKPRRLYMPGVPLTGEFGLPVFTVEGKVLGVPVMQGLNEEQMGAADWTTRTAMQELTCGLILPAADVVEATKQARLTAATQPAEGTEAAASEPAASPPQGEAAPAPAEPKHGE